MDALILGARDAHCALLFALSMNAMFGCDTIHSEPKRLESARKAMQIEIIALTKVSEMPASDVGCRDWILTTEDVKYFFAHARTYAMGTWYELYIVLITYVRTPADLLSPSGWFLSAPQSSRHGARCWVAPVAAGSLPQSKTIGSCA